jgi:arylformamidase
MSIHDISMEIHDNMMVYKNKQKKQPRRKITHKYSVNGVNESKITLGLHTGTHIDAHLHMSEEGDTIESIRLDKLITKARVLDFTNLTDSITAEDLKSKDIEKGSFILFKTRNSFEDRFNFKFIYLEKSGAKYLSKIGIVGVGTDSLGIERSQRGHPTHKALMESGIVIIEGLRLREIDEGEYMMYALPLKIRGGDGAPARVVLEDL